MKRSDGRVASFEQRLETAQLFMPGDFTDGYLSHNFTSAEAEQNRGTSIIELMHLGERRRGPCDIYLLRAPPEPKLHAVCAIYS